MRVLRFVCAFLTLAIFMGAAPVRAVDTDAPPTKWPEDTLAQKELNAIAAANDLDHISFVLMHDEHFLADVGYHTDSYDKVDIGSISKSITAIGIALLIQDGKLKLDTKIGPLLAPAYKAHHRTMPKLLKNITVERLLTHTAGLRPNKLHGEANGLSTVDIKSKLPENATLFDFLAASNADVPDGSNRFVYSNFSYLMLGMVIEAASGQNYFEFCKTRIFDPLKIKGPRLLTGINGITAPYDGWRTRPGVVAYLWSKVFNRDKPTILTTATLDMALLAPLGAVADPATGARYTLGAYIKQDNVHNYTLWHRGLKGHQFTYISETYPDMVWMIAMQGIDQSDSATLDKLSKLPALFEPLAEKALHDFQNHVP